MQNENSYFKVSDYYKQRFGEKVYRLPINTGGRCPHQQNGGCTYCGGQGGVHENLAAHIPIQQQLTQNMAHIGKKYGAKKFIAYFQSYTATYKKTEQFFDELRQAVLPGVIGISISTRPDCLDEALADAIAAFATKHQLYIEIELGLQSVNRRTLEVIHRGHTLETYIKTAEMLVMKGFFVITHLIGNLPWDKDSDLLQAAKLLNNIGVQGVKLHSLFILRNTVLGEQYIRGDIQMIPWLEYKARVILFLRHLRPEMVVFRLFGRAPAEETLFCNWGHSWRKLQNQIVQEMRDNDYHQGDLYE